MTSLGLQVSCPIILTSDRLCSENNVVTSIRENINQNLLTAEDLVKLGNQCLSFQLKILRLSTTNRPALDGNIKAEFTLDFHENGDLLKKFKAKFPQKDIEHKNCHFEAIGLDGNHNGLSICNVDEITGLFRFGHKTYFLSYDRRAENFVLIAAAGDLDESCDFADQHENRWELRDTGYFSQLVRRQKREIPKNTAYTMHIPNYYQDYLDGIKRYVELAFVADNSIYKKYDKDERKIHERLQSIASVVNSLYAPLNIRVTLVWADIWADKDRVEVNTEADKTLMRFLAYRKSDILNEHHHDNAHLITDTRFGEVIGKAYKGTMCSYDYSGGVIVDHAENAAFVGGTVAHEMGHNLGMDHDMGYPEPCKCSAFQCIMAPSSSTVNATTYFSDCSLKELDKRFKHGADYCLHNVPKVAFGGAKCGNGILEEGEECDCGSTTSCPNRCCVPSTCRLAEHAECADGDCCDTETCKPKSMATVCRKSTNSCDLPEFCDGSNPICPPDFFVQNGHLCPDDPESYCYEGVCGSRNQQCRMIWGPSGENSADQCYDYNQLGTLSGNCGYNPQFNEYLKCKHKDVKCGRLQCRHLSEKPIFGDPTTVYSVYNHVRLKNGEEAACRSIRTTYTGGKREADPGMVPDGANCGDNMMCLNAQCQNRSAVVQMVSKCEPVDCNGKGVCNSVGNCHCIEGYGGPSCDIPGYGGSVNSGPASDRIFNPGLALLYFALVGAIVFAVATYYCKKHKNFWLHKKIWKAVKETLKIRSTVHVPTRRAPPIPNAKIQHTHRLSFSALWNDSSTTNSNNHSGNSAVLQPKVAETLRVGAQSAVVYRTSPPVEEFVVSDSSTALATQRLPKMFAKRDDHTHHYNRHFSRHEPSNSLPVPTLALSSTSSAPQHSLSKPVTGVTYGWKAPRDEEMVLVNPYNNEPTCTSSTSPSPPATLVVGREVGSEEVEPAPPIHFKRGNDGGDVAQFSNRDLMRQIKEGVEQRERQSPSTTSWKSNSLNDAATIPPPPPPHRPNAKKAVGGGQSSNTASDAIVHKSSPTAQTGAVANLGEDPPAPPLKPSSVVAANRAKRLAAKAGSMDKANSKKAVTVDSGDVDDGKALSVKQLAARFGQ